MPIVLVPFCCQSRPDPLKHGLHSTSEGVVHQEVSNRSFRLVSCEVGLPETGIVCPALPTDIHFVEGHIFLLREATAIKEYRYHERVFMVNAMQQ